jgi:hypothetical protein
MLTLSGLGRQSRTLLWRNLVMAAKLVPCGDEVSTSTLLKQAMDKHIKR